MCFYVWDKIKKIKVFEFSRFSRAVEIPSNCQKKHVQTTDNKGCRNGQKLYLAMLPLATLVTKSARKHVHGLNACNSPMRQVWMWFSHNIKYQKQGKRFQRNHHCNVCNNGCAVNMHRKQWSEIYTWRYQNSYPETVDSLNHFCDRCLGSSALLDNVLRRPICCETSSYTPETWHCPVNSVAHQRFCSTGRLVRGRTHCLDQLVNTLYGCA